MRHSGRGCARCAGRTRRKRRGYTMVSGGLHERPRRRAFASVAAVVLIGLAAFAFLGLTALVRHDLRRTTRANAEVQLRQLLLAGEQLAAARIASGAAAGTHPVPLPQALVADGGRVDLAFGAGEGGADERAVTVEVAFRGLRASQRLTYARRDGAWALTRADLAPTAGFVAPPRANE